MPPLWIALIIVIFLRVSESHTWIDGFSSSSPEATIDEFSPIVIVLISF